MGKRFVQKAIDAFEESHPGVRIELRVTRRPYSWAGDDRTVEQGKVQYMSQSFREAKGYDEAPKSTDIERTPMDELGRLSSIDFDTAKEMKWHPVDSQRTILWAARFGLAEEFAVFDRWFAAFPGPSWPNHLFSITGTSAGCTETSDMFQCTRGECSNGRLGLY